MDGFITGITIFNRVIFILSLMKQTRKTIQVVIVILAYITFKRTQNVPLMLTLYVLLVSVMMQEFLYIFNTEKEQGKNDVYINDKYRYLRTAGVVIIELLTLAFVYYLSTIMVAALRP